MWHSQEQEQEHIFLLAQLLSNLLHMVPYSNPGIVCCILDVTGTCMFKSLNSKFLIGTNAYAHST